MGADDSDRLPVMFRYSALRAHLFLCIFTYLMYKAK